MPRIPDETSKVDILHLRIDATMSKILTRLAKEKKLTKSQTVRSLLEEALKRRGFKIGF